MLTRVCLAARLLARTTSALSWPRVLPGAAPTLRLARSCLRATAAGRGCSRSPTTIPPPLRATSPCRSGMRRQPQAHLACPNQTPNPNRHSLGRGSPVHPNCRMACLPSGCVSAVSCALLSSRFRVWIIVVGFDSDDSAPMIAFQGMKAPP